MRKSARRADPVVQSSLLVQRDRFVPYLLGRISRGIASAASILYRKRLGVGINDSRIVIVLARRPRITAKELSEDTSLNKSVISRSLGTLKSKGIVRIDERQSRREVELTAAGRNLHERISKVALEREDLMLKGFSIKEREVLLGYLHRITKNVPLANGYDPLSRKGSRRND
ncbi:MAG: MarR family transcriptional regulator [Gammaproteobacteria bacterium]